VNQDTSGRLTSYNLYNTPASNRKHLNNDDCLEEDTKLICALLCMTAVYSVPKAVDK